MSEGTTIRTYERDIDAPVPLLTCAPADPFLIDDRCINQAGHYPIASCGAVVCVHCAKVFWQ